jgi:hypothetical protein
LIWNPENVPDAPAQLPGFLRRLINSLVQALNAPVDSVSFVQRSTEPAKYWVGMVVYADATLGATANFGAAGEGLYVRKSGGWALLG